MQGEYRGDFTRDTFDPRKHFLRVLLQQGRVTLDADFNEQAAILLHYLQTLAMDLIGPHGGLGDSFKINELKENGEAVPRDFVIQPGHYYVDGILCENDLALAYTGQASYPVPNTDKLENGKTYLVYLDVWERHITYIQDDIIREVALNGPDTATRAKVVWQVKITNKTADDNGFPATVPAGYADWRAWVAEEWPDWIKKWQPGHRGMLKSRVKPQEALTDPCVTSPESRYRGAENQLYRVEIHRGGMINDPRPTFKYSRNNGSVTFPMRSLAGNKAILEHLGRDSCLSLESGDWVEVVDDNNALRGEAGPLVQVDTVDRAEMTVTLRSTPAGFAFDKTKHPLLRRWDHKATESGNGAVLIKEGTDNSDWIELEDGIQIQFQPGATYRPGDYWLIPARTATGDVEWPQIEDEPGQMVPEARPPHGVKHHYAPLAIIGVAADGKPEVKSDLRRKIKPLGESVP